MLKTMTKMKVGVFTAIAVIIVGALTTWFLKRSREEHVYVPPAPIEVTDELVKKIIPGLIPAGHEKDKVKILVEDLDGNGTKDIVLSSAVPPDPELGITEAKITIVEPTDTNGNYKLVAEYPFVERRDSMPYATNALDFDADGRKELLVRTGFGGAYTNESALFKINWDSKTLTWTKAGFPDGSKELLGLLQGASVKNYADFALVDLDSDRTLEIVVKGASLVDEAGNSLDPKNWEWNILIYKWNGEFFAYKPDLTKANVDKFKNFTPGE